MPPKDVQGAKFNRTESAPNPHRIRTESAPNRQQVAVESSSNNDQRLCRSVLAFK